MKTVVGFGELMLRLTSPGYERIMQTPHFNATFAGGEANVCVSCSRFGLPSRYVSAFPKNTLGIKAEELLLAQKVDTSAISWVGNRMGIYFVERGANQRSSTVLYDREHSSISEAKPEDFDWEKIFENAYILQISGITPAISQSASDLTMYAVKEAKKRGVAVCCDINYRKKLWNYGKKPIDIMPEIVKNTDLLVVSKEDVEYCLGIDIKGLNKKDGEFKPEDYEPIMKKIVSSFPNVKAIASTMRESISANHNNWGGVYYTDNKLYISKKYNMTDIVDRVGGGDSFTAGIITGREFFENNQDVIEFAVASSALKHSIDGDWNLINKEEVLTLMAGDGTGRVQR